MNTKVKLMLFLCILSFAVWALRFVPSSGLSIDVADFTGGMGVGLAVGLIVTWLGQRTPR